jgi:phosphoribosyl 1,2-cyclic phosphodiesterase
MGACVTVLASGSSGNSALVASATTRVLVDAGLSCKELTRRLRASGEDPSGLDAILITHEHSDHVAGLRVLAKKYEIPVYMTGATHAAWKREARDSKGQPCSLESLEVFEAGHTFSVGDICITPFTIPHDAVDPVGFTMRVDGVKVSIATDLGYLPASVKHHLRGSDVLLIESNHDLEMLRNGPYPWVVKQRVMSRVGHLSNAALAEFLVTDYDGSAAYVILAHLSEQNNHPELVRTAAERALERHGSLLLQNRILLAQQPEPLAPIRL